MAKKPETKFKEKVQDLLKTLPRTWFVKTQEVAIRGIPDILMCINGHFVALELKKDDDEEPDALQNWNLDRIMKAGGVSMVVTPGNFTDVFNTLVAIALGRINAKPEEVPDTVLSS